MANRPFFIPSINKEELVETQAVEFKWFSGFAKTQKQKSVLSFHENISKSVLMAFSPCATFGDF